MLRWAALWWLWLPATTLSDKTTETSTVRYCNCAFDCIFQAGIKHHGVSLTEADLSLLPDVEPWRLDMALQRKCMERFDNFRFPTPPSKDHVAKTALPEHNKDHAEPLPEPQRPEDGGRQPQQPQQRGRLEDDIFESLVFFTLFVVCSACVAAILMLNRGVGAGRVALRREEEDNNTTAPHVANAANAASVSYAVKQRHSPDSEVSWSPLPMPQDCNNRNNHNNHNNMCKLSVVASSSTSSDQQCSACLHHEDEEEEEQRHNRQQALYF